MKDIDDNWSNSNMDYETNSDSDSEIDDYNYNSNTNNWSTLTGDKINRQTNKHNNSFLDRINRKLESLENIDRSAIHIKDEKKSDSFLDLYERMKALNSPLKQESKFEPHHRSSFTKTMTDSWYINNNSKDVIDKNLQTLKATYRRVDEETSPIKERLTRIEDKRKDLIKDRGTIESVKDIINEDKERGKIRKGMVKEMLEKIEGQKSLIETKNKEIRKEMLKKDNGTCWSILILIS